MVRQVARLVALFEFRLAQVKSLMRKALAVRLLWLVLRLARTRSVLLPLVSLQMVSPVLRRVQAPVA